MATIRIARSSFRSYLDNDVAAVEFVRVAERKKPRTDWAQRILFAVQAVKHDGVIEFHGTKLVATPDSPVWAALGAKSDRFRDATGRNSPPFAYNSGMGWNFIRFARSS